MTEKARTWPSDKKSEKFLAADSIIFTTGVVLGTSEYVQASYGQSTLATHARSADDSWSSTVCSSSLRFGHTLEMRRLVFAVVAVSVFLAACASDNETGNGEVALTLGRAIEEIQPDPGTTVEFQILTDDNAVFANTYPVEFSGSDYRTELETVLLDATDYQIRATVKPSGATCSVEVDLSDKVEMTVSALIRTECFLETEETEEWHDASGAVLPTSVIQEFYGGGHCGWEDVRFIALGEYFIGDSYLLDPSNVFDPELFVAASARERLGLGREERAYAANLEPDDYLTFDLDIELPSAVESLGYERGLRELFRSIDGDYLYVVGPDGVERWPRVLPHPACA